MDPGHPPAEALPQRLEDVLQVDDVRLEDGPDRIDNPLQRLGVSAAERRSVEGGGGHIGRSSAFAGIVRRAGVLSGVQFVSSATGQGVLA